MRKQPRKLQPKHGNNFLLKMNSDFPDVWKKGMYSWLPYNLFSELKPDYSSN